MVEIKVSADQSANLENIRIDFLKNYVEKGWRTIVYPIFEENRQKPANLPTEPGYYQLYIHYENGTDSLEYLELTQLTFEPLFERLSFHFYCENQRMFCDISSITFSGLDKTILMQIPKIKSNKHSDDKE